LDGPPGDFRDTLTNTRFSLCVNMNEDDAWASIIWMIYVHAHEQIWIN